MCSRLFSLAVIASFASAAPLLAQAHGTTINPDLKELAAYTLTMDTLNRVDRATRAMVAEVQKDPRYGEQMKVNKELAALREKEDPSDADMKRMEQLEARSEQLEQSQPTLNMDGATLSEMAAQIDAIPPLANALRKEGMSSREYAKFTMAMLQAAFAAAAVKTGGKAPGGVNPANVKFVQEHEADLKRMQESYAALGAGK